MGCQRQDLTYAQLRKDSPGVNRENHDSLCPFALLMAGRGVTLCSGGIRFISCLDLGTQDSVRDGCSVWSLARGGGSLGPRLSDLTEEGIGMAMSEARSNEEVHAAWITLSEEVRTGVLLTLRNGRPFGSHVPYVFGEQWTRAYIHVSRLALHTGHLLQDVRVGLFVSEPDRPEKNPSALRRMNLQGEAVLLQAGGLDYAAAKERYLARFPQSAMMFGFADFSLWELRLQDAHLILGFGQAYLADATTPLSWIHQEPSTKGVTRET